jgi:beta-phosphoglucomutase
MIESARAVIFDIDGVLVDSYDAHLRSWQMLARETGVTFTDADFVKGFGQTSRDILREWWKLTDEREIKRLDERKESLYRSIVDDDFPVMHGAVELIDALHAAGFMLAMGSSGPPENVQLAMDRLKRRVKFGAAISGMDVKHGKPAPDIFLAAAQRLDVPPSRCIVIEDAPPGVRAARAAGMRCVVLLSRGRHRGDFIDQPPDMFVESLRQIRPDMLDDLLTSPRTVSPSRSPVP